MRWSSALATKAISFSLRNQRLRKQLDEATALEKHLKSSVKEVVLRLRGAYGGGSRRRRWRSICSRSGSISSPASS